MREHANCEDCGEHVAFDEDGCCAQCGAGVTIVTCECDSADVAACDRWSAERQTKESK